MLRKLQASFQLSIVVLFGICSALVLAPFAVYRFLTGAFLAGVLDVIVMICIGCFVAYALKSKKVELYEESKK